MPSADDSSARPKGSSSSKDELAYYKAQYEQLEAELTDFQASSRELEAELEKDIEASEKRERQLKEKLDSLRYEVDEWKASFDSFVFASATRAYNPPADKVQAVENGRRRCAERLAERDHNFARYEPDASIETT